MSKRVVVLARAFAIVCVIAACVSCDDESASNASTPARSLRCTWPMFGQSASRTFSYPEGCDTTISSKSVNRLREKWFHRTPDVVTATPALTNDTAFVGDWSGNFFALSLDDGKVRWTFKAPKHQQVYSGQIVASAAVADVDGERRVFFASGKTLYALRASDGELRWKHELNPDGAVDDPTEIQSSPVVVDGLVIAGYDGHDSPGTRAGIVALDAKTGNQRWNFDPDRGGEASGCSGFWSSPSVDTERGLLFAGSANCPTSPRGWNEFSEAIVALDVDSGVPEWTYQPRGPSNNDFDFAGAPNLFNAGDRAVVGLGGKDGVYYALDRERGELVWKIEAARPEPQSPNFSTGGFIGATAVDKGLVVGGTAIGGPCPCLHAINTSDGTVAWQQSEAGPTFAPSAIVGDVAFAGSTTDFTLRALDLDDGTVLWSQQLVGGVAGGVAVSGDTVIAVAGIREPGVDPAGTESGVYGFTIGPSGTTTSTGVAGGTLPPSTMAPPPTAPDPNAPMRPTCVARPCEVSFTLKEPPAGTSPAVTVHLRPDPFRIEVRADGLGSPADWITPGSPAAAKGAVTYGVFASDDAQRGSLLCVLDADFDCVSETLPEDLRPNYNRISVLAIANTPELPSASEGFARLVTTVSLDDPVALG
jgi:outer membrane protein assembly factor BamB